MLTKGNKNMQPQDSNPLQPNQGGASVPPGPKPTPAPSPPNLGAQPPSQASQPPQVVGPQHSNGQPLFAPDTAAKPPKSKRRLPKILLVVLLVLLLIGGGGGYAYLNALNNRPEKVLADAISNSMTDLLDRKPSTFVSKTVYESKGDDAYTITVDIDAKQAQDDFETAATIHFEGSGIDLTAKGAVIVMDTKELFVRFDDLEKTANDIVAINPETQVWVDAFRPLIQKIDSKWIKIDSESIAQAGLTESEHEIDACSEAVKKLRIKPEDKSKIKDIFERNQFAIATEKLPKEKASGEESFHYKLDFNERAGLTFTKELIELPSFATVKKDCEVDTKSLDRELKELEEREKEHADGHEAGHHEDEPKPVIELWVGADTRLPTRLKVTLADKELTTTFDTTVKINAGNIKISAPRDALSMTDILEDIQTLNTNY
jgi:hypothetical protein